MITLRHIELVQTLDRHRHFGRAAEALGITQSALTRALQTLETDLGVRLFDRGPGTPEPTQFGRIVLEWGQPVVRSMDNLAHEISLARGLEVGEITVSAGVFPTELWVPQALARLAMEFPKIRYHMRCSEARRAVRDVLSGSADIAVADLIEVQGFDELAFEELITVNVSLFCRPGHPLLRHEVVKQTDLLDFPMAGPRPSHFTSEAMQIRDSRALTVSKTGGFVPRIWVESFTAMRHAVTASDTVSWAPVSLLEPYVRRGEFAALTMKPGPVDITFGLIYPRHRTLSPAAMVFIKIVKAIINETPIPRDLAGE